MSTNVKIPGVIGFKRVYAIIILAITIVIASAIILLFWLVIQPPDPTYPKALYPLNSKNDPTLIPTDEEIKASNDRLKQEWDKYKNDPESLRNKIYAPNEGVVPGYSPSGGEKTITTAVDFESTYLT